MIYTVVIKNWEGRIVAQKIFTRKKQAEEFSKKDKYKHMAVKIKKVS